MMTGVENFAQRCNVECGEVWTDNDLCLSIASFRVASPGRVCVVVTAVNAYCPYQETKVPVHVSEKRALAFEKR